MHGRLVCKKGYEKTIFLDNMRYILKPIVMSYGKRVMNHVRRPYENNIGTTDLDQNILFT